VTSWLQAGAGGIYSACKIRGVSLYRFAERRLQKKFLVVPSSAILCSLPLAACRCLGLIDRVWRPSVLRLGQSHQPGGYADVSLRSPYSVYSLRDPSFAYGTRSQSPVCDVSSSRSLQHEVQSEHCEVRRRAEERMPRDCTPVESCICSSSMSSVEESQPAKAEHVARLWMSVSDHVTRQWRPSQKAHDSRRRNALDFQYAGSANNNGSLVLPATTTMILLMALSLTCPHQPRDGCCNFKNRFSRLAAFPS
jgi:hypothetical protein